jgi:DNA mismatch repair protein MutS
MSDTTIADPADTRVSPVMEQFIEIKAANPDCLLFYRMGDFYELFFRDAEEASRALGIVLTKRGKHLGEDIPMCGVPIHRADEYLNRLIQLGFRVAVAEQLEDPAEARKRGSKSVVKRDVVRLVTPGTLTEESLLDPGRANYLLAVSRLKDGEVYGLAWIDISTGVFRVNEAEAGRLGAEIARVDPAEIVAPDKLLDDPVLRGALAGGKTPLVPMPGAAFEAVGAETRLAQWFAVASLEAFGTFSRAELAAAAGAVAYVERTQLATRARLDPPVRDGAGAVVAIDAATRSSLEILRSQGGERRGSLVATIDRTVSGPGQRLLAERLASPSTERSVIERRLAAVDRLVGDTDLAETLHRHLAAAPDLMRPLNRLAMGRGGPRDLAAIRDGLVTARALVEVLAGADGLGEELEAARDGLAAAPFALGAALDAALGADLPLFKRDGGFIATGHSAELDELRALSADSRRLIAGLEADYQAETGIKSLKIKYNNVLGYFVEVAQQYGDRLMQPPLNARYIHRQTMANAMRFATVDVSDLEARIASAGERALGLELALFEDFANRVAEEAAPIGRAAEALAVLDVSAALAAVARAENWCRPVVDGSLDLRIVGGRHPVVEAALRRDGGGPFVANDCELSPTSSEAFGRLVILTGPNMGGKSTWLRQNALIVLLAQAGSFVPAASAKIGIVDRLFSRVGAADDLARGRSTFMVEMIETAAILNQAGPRSLVILDEIGRGTSTFDGLSIAWGAIEHLNAVNRCRTLFATHYHELTALAERLPRIDNRTVKVREWKGDVVFLHEIIAGAADRSYGIQVAKLAGLPNSVIQRARSVLKELEEHDRKRPGAALIDELPLFSTLKPAPEPEAPEPHEPAAPALDPAEAAALEALKDVDPDDLTPRGALDALYRLKGLLKG